MRRDFQFVLDRLSLETRLGPQAIVLAVVAAAVASPLFEPIWAGPGLTQTAADRHPAWLAAVPGALSLADQSRTPPTPFR